jgi:hypothetical protein
VRPAEQQSLIDAYQRWLTNAKEGDRIVYRVWSLQDSLAPAPERLMATVYESSVEKLVLLFQQRAPDGSIHYVAIRVTAKRVSPKFFPTDAKQVAINNRKKSIHWKE